MINPNNNQLKEGEMYYDYEIANHTLNYYLFQEMVVSCIACFIYKFQLNDIEIRIAKTENLIRDSNTRESDINANNENQIVESPQTVQGEKEINLNIKKKL